MKRYYACLLGNWVDITDAGTVEDHQKPSIYFADNLTYEEGSKVAKCFEYDYIHVQYGKGNRYRVQKTGSSCNTRMPRSKQMPEPNIHNAHLRNLPS